MIPQSVKNMANVAENHVNDARKFVFSMGRRTMSSVSISSTTSSKLSDEVPDKSARAKTAPTRASSDSSLMANTLLWTHLIPPMPVIASTMYRHFAKGPPAKSWSLSSDITIAVIRDFLARSSKITVEDVQKLSTTKKLPIPSNVKRRKFVVPDEYRKRAGDLIAPLLSKKDQRRVGWDWQRDRETAPPIKGEWLQSKGNPLDPCKESTVLYLHGGAYYLGCYGIYRQFLARLVKYSKARTCAIDYRLAPQHPFPAAVEDALATYLYLIDPPKDEDTQPIDPKKIVIAGDSAGGGLTFATLMVIRDAGLPAPGGAMALSPWMDLTHSLPSILTNIMTDYLPPTGFKHAPSPALDYAQLPFKEEDAQVLAQAKAEAEAARDDHGNLAMPTAESDISDTGGRTSIGPFGECVPVPSIDGTDIYRVQFYACNDALKLPMVSPIFDRGNLRGLPRLLVQCGTAERLRDESVYTALQASNSFPGANRDTAALGELTHVTLETYTDQPHVFQLLFSNKSVSRAIKNLAAFVRDVTDSPAAIDNLNDKEGKTSYVTDRALTVRNINPLGKTTDITKQFLKDFTRKEWKDWETRLARPSIKQRMDDVSAAYEKCLKEEHHKHDIKHV
ncbi:Alpha/Beta hydrolase protein [Parasitella parasitica]|nr:Alpha/Beta hydrolase protein [Parasitella parasitica]